MICIPFLAMGNARVDMVGAIVALFSAGGATGVFGSHQIKIRFPDIADDGFTLNQRDGD